MGSRVTPEARLKRIAAGKYKQGKLDVLRITVGGEGDSR